MVVQILSYSNKFLWNRKIKRNYLPFWVVFISAIAKEIKSMDIKFRLLQTQTIIDDMITMNKKGNKDFFALLWRYRTIFSSIKRQWIAFNMIWFEWWKMHLQLILTSYFKELTSKNLVVEAQNSGNLRFTSQ